MKKLYALALFLTVNACLKAQSYQYLGSFNSNGRPNYLDTRDTVSPSLLSDIDASLPEGYPVPTFNPQYIANGVPTDIILTDSADVWVTFVGEGAGYRNVLGYYTYDITNPFITAPTPADIKIVFPNVSALYSGGELLVGDRVKIGTFPANTGIGWVLLANGFQNSVVTSGQWTLYSDPRFNPESDVTLRNHNVLLNDSANGLVVLGFEDIRRDYSSCDQDFNDALFYVKSNPIEAISTTGMEAITPTGQGVSSGFNGGLESHGGLSQLIGKRNLNRMQKGAKPAQFINEQYRYVELPAAAKKSSGTVSLEQLPPAELLCAKDAFTTTPYDLLTITNAQEVLAVDYMDGEQRKASFLATRTQGDVYDHTKTICDRLTGAELLNVEVVEINGFEFLQSTIKRTNGEIEYATTFSVFEEDGVYDLQSLWNLANYRKGDEVINVQVWASAPAYTKELVMKVIFNLPDQTTQQQLPEVPEVYVSKAFYKDGSIQAVFKNRGGATGLEVSGVLRATEVESAFGYEESVSLRGEKTQEVSIATGHLFDAGLAFYSNGKMVDYVYQADGSWGLDYQQAYTQIQSFEIDESTTDEVLEDEYLVERSVRIAAATNDYVSVYRFLKAGAMPINLEEYKSLKLDFAGHESMEIFLMLENTNWQDYPSVKVLQGEVSVSLEQFGDVDLTKVTGLIFAFSPTDDGAVEAGLKNVRFSKKTSVFVADSNLNALEVYPNPAIDKLNFWATEEMGSEGAFSVQSLDGVELMNQEVSALGSKEIRIENIPTGVYIVKYTTAKGEWTGKILKR